MHFVPQDCVIITHLAADNTTRIQVLGTHVTESPKDDVEFGRADPGSKNPILRNFTPELHGIVNGEQARVTVSVQEPTPGCSFVKVVKQRATGFTIRTLTADHKPATEFNKVVQWEAWSRL